MIPSGSKPKESNRPHSSTGFRPASRNVLRPQSSIGHRPQSSLSARIPAGSRPQSRLAQRPNSRQARSRLKPYCESLVAAFAGTNEGENLQDLAEYVASRLEGTTLQKAAASVDITVIDRQISGLAEKARINSHDALGKALEVCYEHLKRQLEEQESDLDATIKASRLPDHLQFLLYLSRQPEESTLRFADAYLEERANPQPAPKALTWADILADEPFEGEHWEGVYGLPPGFVKSAEDDDDWDSSRSLSPLNSDDLALDEDDSTSSSDYNLPHSPTHIVLGDFQAPQAKEDNGPDPHEQRQLAEELKSRQYWREDWRTDADPWPTFDIGNPSSLGPTLNHISLDGGHYHGSQSLLATERHINEDDMVHEVLMALQGYKNILFSWADAAGGLQTTPATPRLIHLSLASQESILRSLAGTATMIENLRRFAKGVLSQSTLSSQPRKHGYDHQRKATSTRTCEAFADAIDNLVRDFEAWCAQREDAISRAAAGVDGEPLVVSLLDTEKAIRDAYEDTFDVLIQVIQSTFRVPPKGNFASFEVEVRQSPAALTALLLDTLFSNVQRHMERQDRVTSGNLMRVFVRTAEPIWTMMGQWLQDGMAAGLSVGSGGSATMGQELDDEFFIESSGVGVGVMSFGLLDPDFWKEGYSLREETYGPGDATGVPVFLQHIASLVLGAGKAVGLIRALGIVSTVSLAWKSFEELTKQEHGADGHQKATGLFSVSVDTLSRVVYDELLPYCHQTGSQLIQVLEEDCDLWRYLNSLEDLYLMRRGDTMTQFLDVVFTKMDSQQSWGDFHFLNTAFGDVIEANQGGGSKEWISSLLVRLSYRGGKEREKTILHTVKAIDGLSVEYMVPFPLTYMFPPSIIQQYNEIFVFLLQIRRAKSVLERILIRGDRGRDHMLREEMKSFYAMRSRLSWFVNTLLNFLTTYVIHAEVTRFHSASKKATLFDDMISLHEEHLDKVRGRCLLKPNTSALHRAMLSILDMCLLFSDAFILVSGENAMTLDVSRGSISMKRHRSRRLRQQRKNVIGFSQFLHDDDSSDDDDDDDGGADVLETSMMGSQSMLSIDDDVFARLGRMSTELDGLVKFIRRGVESLSGGTTEAASTFGVLAFALEDWDI